MKVNLYFNFIKVKSLTIKDVDKWKQDYKVTIWFQKRFFGANKVTVVLRPVKLLHSTDKCLDIETRIYEGAEIKNEQFERI